MLRSKMSISGKSNNGIGKVLHFREESTGINFANRLQLSEVTSKSATCVSKFNENVITLNKLLDFIFLFKDLNRRRINWASSRVAELSKHLQKFCDNLDLQHFSSKCLLLLVKVCACPESESFDITTIESFGQNPKP